MAADNGKSAVIGSTGFAPAQIREAEALTRKIPCVLSPNMSVGVNVMFKIIGEVAGSWEMTLMSRWSKPTTG